MGHKSIFVPKWGQKMNYGSSLSHRRQSRSNRIVPLSKRMFKGKLCVVTGGGSGIGRALCEELVKAGAGGVYVVDINRESALKVAASLQSLAVNHHHQTNNNFRFDFGAADVGDEDDMKRVINDAWQSFGQIDVFFSNAGIMTFGGIDDVSNEQWEKIWNVNVMSHVFAARHLFPLWRRQEKSSEGIFVITASAAGLLLQIGSLPYTVTKHAAVNQHTVFIRW